MLRRRVRLVWNLLPWVIGIGAFVGRLAGAETPVILPQFEVSDSAVYRPREKGWSRAETPGFVLFSHDDRIATEEHARLARIREALGVILPDIAAACRDVQVTIVVAHGDDDEYRVWSGRAGENARDAFVTSVPLRTGVVLLVDADREIRTVNGLATGTTSAEITRAYALALLGHVRGMPRWVAEGLAQVLKGTEAFDRKIVVGRNEMFANVDDHTLMRLRFVAAGETPDRLTPRPPPGPVGGGGTLPGAAAGTRNQAETFLLYNFGETYGEALAKIDEVTVARLTGAASSYTEYFISRHEGVTLSELVDPRTPDSLAWRMTAWAFVHMGLFGADAREKERFGHLLRTLASGTAADAAYADAYGEPATKLTARLASFSERGRYLLNVFKLAEPLARPAAPVFHAIGDREILPLEADVLAATQRPDAAIALLRFAVRFKETRSPAATESLARLLSAHDPVAARALLEDETRPDGLTPATQLLLARLRLAALAQPGHALDVAETALVLRPAFAALKAGADSAELYLLITDCWLASAAVPTEENLSAPLQGRQRHPENRELAAKVDELLKRRR